MTEIQNKDLGLIRKIARHFANTTSLEFDDAFSIATVGYCRAIHKYNPEKYHWSTYAYKSMRGELINHLPKKETHEEELAYLEPLSNRSNLNPEQTVSFKETLLNMGKEAREVCEIIFESPHEFVSGKPKLDRGELKRKLREQGWSWPKIYRGFREIRETLTELT